MQALRVLTSTILLTIIFIVNVPAFDTGSHFDLTRSVLSERGFDDDTIKIVQIENWLTDYYSSAPTIHGGRRSNFRKLHFDNLYTTIDVKNYWSWLLTNIKNETQNAARADDSLAALALLGVGLHAVQDFYTHSNWVETHTRVPGEAFRTETYSPATSTLALFTGKYPDDRKSGPGRNADVAKDAPVHGGYRTGINHDSLIRPGWAEAYVFAYVGSHELVDAMEQWAEEVRSGFWARVLSTSINARERKKLEYDITALRSMSMWLNGKGADGHWKGDKSGSSRFFGAFSSRWVISDSSVFVQKMKDGEFEEKLTANLYANMMPPPMPKLPRFSAKRRAVIVRTTLIKESSQSGKLGTAIKKLLSPDYYQRLTVGKQEFWGRAIQASRELVDPWYEIYFTDQDTKTVPIEFSVWDEDSPDYAKDAPIDINPVPGKNILDLIFNTAGGSVTGDVAGIFDTPETAFMSSGEKPDKNQATIKAFITHFDLR